MTFDPQYVDDFKTMFDEKKEFIGNFPGCKGVQLLQTIEGGNIFFTYSFWESPYDLENYRHSELFKTVWAQTKQWFADKPDAWSVDVANHSENFSY
tara:strand:+ start:899 stop:1186 length:288 start_codon:yes stop_codon:yes gene_type:complete